MAHGHEIKPTQRRAELSSKHKTARNLLTNTEAYTQTQSLLTNSPGNQTLLTPAQRRQTVGIKYDSFVTRGWPRGVVADSALWS